MNASNYNKTTTKLTSSLNLTPQQHANSIGGAIVSLATSNERFAEKDSKRDRNDYEQMRSLIEELTTVSRELVSAVDEVVKQETLAAKENFTNKKNIMLFILNVDYKKWIDSDILTEDEKNNIKKIRTELIELDKSLHFTIPFDDKELQKARAMVTKESGANVGYTVTNDRGKRFTVKQGKTVGNTLSEVFSSMALQGSAKTAEAKGPALARFANAILVARKPAEDESTLSVEERCHRNLFAASEWSSDKASFEACQLFGLKKRKKAAGTRQSDDFKDLLALNRACHLGLEKIVIPTAIAADFDFHTENFMLKINDQNVALEKKGAFNILLKLFKDKMSETHIKDRQQRLDDMVELINQLKNLGADVYFHKIDHDSGFYRYSDPDRKVDFSTHRTSPLYREGFRVKTQPTLHITEVTGGTKSGIDQLLLSDEGVDQLLNATLEKERTNLLGTAAEFMLVIREKALSIVNNSSDTKGHLAAEFYLLNEFYHHISRKNINIKSEVTKEDIATLQNVITLELLKGAELKVKDLHLQIYKRLSEKEKEGSLTEKQRILKLDLEKKSYLKSVIEKKQSDPISLLRHAIRRS